jgi:hypothetical protein
MTQKLLTIALFSVMLVAGCGGAGSSMGGTEAGNPTIPLSRIVQGIVSADETATKSALSCAVSQVVATDSLATTYSADVEVDCAFHLSLPVNQSYMLSLLEGGELVALFLFQDDQGVSTQTMFVGAGDTPIDLGSVTISDGVATPEHVPAEQSADDCDLDAGATDGCSLPASSDTPQVLEVRPFSDQGISAGSDPVGRNQDVQVRVSCEVDPASVTAITFSVNSSEGAIACDYRILNAGSLVKCLHASQKFDPLTIYTATIDGVRCVGSALVPTTTWSWKTSEKN